MRAVADRPPPADVGLRTVGGGKSHVLDGVASSPSASLHRRHEEYAVAGGTNANKGGGSHRAANVACPAVAFFASSETQHLARAIASRLTANGTSVVWFLVGKNGRVASAATSTTTTAFSSSSSSSSSYHVAASAGGGGGVVEVRGSRTPRSAAELVAILSAGLLRSLALALVRSFARDSRRSTLDIQLGSVQCSDIVTLGVNTTDDETERDHFGRVTAGRVRVSE